MAVPKLYGHGVVTVLRQALRAWITSIVRWWSARDDGRGLRPVDNERSYVMGFLEFLEDRRVLYTPYFLEFPSHVVDSVRQIEAEADTALSLLPSESRATGPIRKVRSACLVFLGRAETRHGGASGAGLSGGILFFAVVALRETLVVEASALAEEFALNLPPELTLALSEQRQQR